MPNISIKIPQHSYPGAARAQLLQEVTEAAAAAEHIPAHASQRALIWVQLDEVAATHWTCGGQDATAQYLPVFAQVHVPAGVLDAAARSLYVSALHQAFVQALPAAERRPVLSSVVLHEVPDASWGANGQIWRLPDFARAAGYAHMQG